MRYARIDNDQLVEISPETEESLATWQARFHPSNQWVTYVTGASEGDTYNERDGTFSPPPPPPIQTIRRQKAEEAYAEASRRRALSLGETSGDELLAIRNWISLTARAVGKVRREASGRTRPGEITELDSLEEQIDALDAIDKARDTILTELKADPDPGSYDVAGSPHWPAEPQP